VQFPLRVVSPGEGSNRCRMLECLCILRMAVDVRRKGASSVRWRPQVPLWAAIVAVCLHFSLFSGWPLVSGEKMHLHPLWVAKKAAVALCVSIGIGSKIE